MVVERREFPRQPLTQEVHCYIDGVRFEAKTLDVSAGGAFVRTSRSRQVSPGALVGLVFLRHPKVHHTTFLFGRVTRIQLEPNEGIALAWEKAVTVAPPEELAKFLADLFAIESPKIQPEAPTTRGQARNVFFFETISARPAARGPSSSFTRSPSSATPAGDTPFDAAPDGIPPVRTSSRFTKRSSAVESAPVPRPADPVPARTPAAVPPPREAEVADPFDAVALGADALDVTSEDLDALDLQVFALEADGTVRHPSEAAPVSESRRASASRPIAPSPEEVQVLLPGRLMLGQEALLLTVLRLGVSRAFVGTGFLPADGDADLSLRFEIPARRGPVPVTCRCRLEEVRPAFGDPGAGLLLRFLAVDEGGNTGVVERYVKYMLTQGSLRS